MSLNVQYWSLKLQAIAHLVLGRNAAAERCFDAMLARWPADAYALSSRTMVRAQRGARDEAIADARALVAHHPQRQAADWFNLAFLLEEAGQYEEAVPVFRQAIELNPQLDRAWYGLGLTLIRLGRLDEAVEALERNTKLQPMSPYGWYQLARVQLDRQHPEETRKIIRHLKKFEPKVAAQLERETGLAVNEV
jgi:tetratricopeptide (TPR) repeat protein